MDLKGKRKPTNQRHLYMWKTNTISTSTHLVYLFITAYKKLACVQTPSMYIHRGCQGRQHISLLISNLYIITPYLK